MNAHNKRAGTRAGWFCGYDRTRDDIIGKTVKNCMKTVKTAMEMRRRFLAARGWTVRDWNALL